MRLVRYGGQRTGLLVAGERVLDAAEALPELGAGADWAPLIAAWEGKRGALEALEADAPDGSGTPLVELELEPPLPSPAARIFAMGGNFPMHARHAVEKLEIEVSDGVTGAEEAPPWGFYVIPGTIVGPDAEVSPPPGTRHFDYEAEVGVVLSGEPPGADGALAIWGYTAWNDLSIRDPAFGLSKVDHGPLTWSLQKNFASANAAGPWLEIDDGAAYGEMRIVCLVNGETRQDGNTREMKHSYAAIAAHIAEHLPLRPGDMILSGTPAGTAMEGGPEGRFLADGDVVEVEAGDVGVLRNRVILEPMSG